jgi:hypothetical protein
MDLCNLFKASTASTTCNLKWLKDSLFNIDRINRNTKCKTSKLPKQLIRTTFNSKARHLCLTPKTSLIMDSTQKTQWSSTLKKIEADLQI